jgi:hypothetical protein
MSLEALAYADHNDSVGTGCDGGLVSQARSCRDPHFGRPPILDEEGNLSEQYRILSHPGFPQVVGQGICLYRGADGVPCNPHRTTNFVYGPARKVDSAVVRTLGASVSVQRQQLDSDVVISEIWDTSISPISTLAGLAVQLQRFYTTPLAVGQLLGWQPRDLSFDRFLVRIVSLQIGGTEYDFLPIPDGDDLEAWKLAATVTLQLKLEDRVIPPRSTMRLEGA